NGADINIKGNKIGYYKEINNSISSTPVADDGIEFHGDVEGSADVDIIDNWIKAQDDGIQFFDRIRNTADVLIGGYNDGNKIWAGDNGISFWGEVKDESLVEIAYNDVDAGQDGVIFKAKTSNAV